MNIDEIDESKDNQHEAQRWTMERLAFFYAHTSMHKAVFAESGVTQEEFDAWWETERPKDVPREDYLSMQGNIYPLWSWVKRSQLSPSLIGWTG
jgi:hypothetical protein